MEILISLLFKLAPYIIMLLGAVGLYFGVKRKGVKEERERQEVKRIEAVKQTVAKVEKAVAKDEAVDAKVAEEVKKIETEHTIKPDIDGKFRF